MNEFVCRQSNASRARARARPKKVFAIWINVSGRTLAKHTKLDFQISKLSALSRARLNKIVSLRTVQHHRRRRETNENEKCNSTIIYDLFGVCHQFSYKLILDLRPMSSVHSKIYPENDRRTKKK